MPDIMCFTGNGQKEIKQTQLLPCETHHLSIGEQLARYARTEPRA